MCTVPPETFIVLLYEPDCGTATGWPLTVTEVELELEVEPVLDDELGFEVLFVISCPPVPFMGRWFGEEDVSLLFVALSCSLTLFDPNIRDNSSTRPAIATIAINKIRILCLMFELLKLGWRGLVGCCRSLAKLLGWKRSLLMVTALAVMLYSPHTQLTR